MKILVTGSTGLIGSALAPSLIAAKHQVVRLVRRKPRPGASEVHWDPSADFIDVPGLNGFDAVVHLAGENIGEGRWTTQRKAKIRNSRVEGTHLLAEGLAQVSNRPKVMVSASAIGYYGNRGSETLREDSPPGSGFLAEVCAEWEAAAQPASAKGIRVVYLRSGVVLSPNGGALAKMLTPFKMGVGGVIGRGDQYWSWIALDDTIGVIHFVLANDQFSGAFNAVAPNPVTNREFTKTLGRVLARPTIFPMPAAVASLALGEMADEMLLGSTRVEPARLLAAGYKFKFPTLEAALRHLLKK
ncbi:MAG: TIGR01777 family protein [Acidobacteria bacterium]|nr:MAG: TIGR01777 family protein [Acidobacteriota bacterium]PYV40710.1 MAG: TIGR01777 family protein [Acidobacteriota bacterium]